MHHLSSNMHMGNDTTINTPSTSNMHVHMHSGSFGWAVMPGGYTTTGAAWADEAFHSKVAIT